MTTHRDAPSTHGHLLKVSRPFLPPSVAALPSACNGEVILKEPEESKAEMLREGSFFFP